MGCYLSKNVPNGPSGRIFRVYNVDDLGAEISPGKIEVTDNDLIFYQKGKEPIRWPLRCLRRYGFDEELFSFESGRRCPTGSGIYAFKGRKAEELFNLVQEAIQNVGQVAHLRASQTMVNGSSNVVTRGASRPTSLIDHEPSGIRLSGSGRVNVVPYDQHLYMNGTVVPSQDSTPNYMNTGAGQPSNRNDTIDDASALIDLLHNPPTSQAPPKPETVNYADLDLPRSTENLFEVCEGACATETSGNGKQEGRESVTGSEDQNGLDVEDVQLNYADLDVFSEPVDDSAHPNYINLDADGKLKEPPQINGKVESVSMNGGAMQSETMKKNLLVRKLSIEQNYANVGAASFRNNVGYDVNPVCMNPSGTYNGVNGNNSANRLSNPGELNYIEIDVNKTDGDSVQGALGSSVSVSFAVPDSPSKRTESYAMIDFNRTVALSNSAKQVTDNEEGLRKTRHNSTIN